MPDQSPAIDIFNMLDCTPPLLVYAYLCVHDKENVWQQTQKWRFFCVHPGVITEQGLAEIVSAVQIMGNETEPFPEINVCLEHLECRRKLS